MLKEVRVMYISKVYIDVKIPAVIHDLSSLNYFYKTLRKISGEGALVFRIDNIPLDQTEYIQPVVLVSEKKPELSSNNIPVGYIAKIESFKYDIPIRNGMIYKYYIKANPSVKLFFIYSDLETSESWIKWFEIEGKLNGFEVIDIKVNGDGYITCAEKKKKFLSVLFEGSLKITDEMKFRKALNYGIGRGIEYGLGLLSIESFGCKNRNIAEEMKNAKVFEDNCSIDKKY